MKIYWRAFKHPMFIYGMLKANSGRRVPNKLRQIIRAAWCYDNAIQAGLISDR